MSKIHRITRLSGFGVFRDFKWSSDLPEFGQYNLIYGWNGTGKTTLSRLLRDLELRRRPTMGRAALHISGNEVAGNSFPQSTLQIRVFNRDFVHTNVFPVGGGDMPPILVLGADNVERQKKVESLKNARAAAQARLQSAVTAERPADDGLDRFCIRNARSIKDALRTSGHGPYNNYNKTNYRVQAGKMADAGDNTTHQLTDPERTTLLARHKGAPKPRVGEVSYALPDLDRIADRAVGLLSTTVVAAAIDALRDNLTLANWTRQGLTLHRDGSPERCLFCDQPLAAGRLDALEAHFSAEYGRLTQRIEREIEELKAASEASEGLQIPSAADLYEHLGPGLQSCERGLREAVVSVRRYLAAVIQALEAKKPRAFEAVKLEVDTPLVDTDVVTKLNAVIRKHNEEGDAFETLVGEARHRLAKHMIATTLDEFIRLRQAAEAASADRRKLERMVRGLDDQIADLEREIVEHRQPAEELNEDLQTYLGHDELCLEIKDTGYAITRGGVSASTLSEGETTAIALLYFLKSLRDRRFELDRGVVVLDDPVSSLDANALFLAFGFIRERAGEAGQLFILTHNFSFFRQVRNWFGHLKGQKKRVVSNRPAQFFMLAAAEEDNVRSSVIQALDPLLYQYDSEYHYLFARIYEAATGSASQDLERHYALPNIARRMLEAFLAFRQPQISGELWRKMQAVPFNEAKKLRILRFLHTHSHSIAVGEPEHDLTALAEGPSVLEDLLEMIESLDGGHFSAMVQLVAPSTKAGRDEG